MRPTSGPPCSLECEFKLLGPVGRMGRDGGAPVEVGGLAQAWVSKSGPGTGSVALGQSSQDTTQTQPTRSQKTICSSHSRELSGSASGFHSGTLSFSSLYHHHKGSTCHCWAGKPHPCSHTPTRLRPPSEPHLSVSLALCSRTPAPGCCLTLQRGFQPRSPPWPFASVPPSL